MTSQCYAACNEVKGKGPGWLAGRAAKWPTRLKLQAKQERGFQGLRTGGCARARAPPPPRTERARRRAVTGALQPPPPATPQPPPRRLPATPAAAAPCTHLRYTPRAALAAACCSWWRDQLHLCLSAPLPAQNLLADWHGQRCAKCYLRQDARCQQAAACQWAPERGHSRRASCLSHPHIQLYRCRQHLQQSLLLRACRSCVTVAALLHAQHYERPQGCPATVYERSLQQLNAVQIL